MQILEGKTVAEKIKSTFEQRLKNIKNKPNIVVLDIAGNNVSDVYIRNIKKNCEKYDIGFNLILSNSNEEFKLMFNKIKNSQDVTGIMFQQPLPQELLKLINEIPQEKDIEGVSAENMGRLFIGQNDAIAPCTSKAVIATLDYYNIDLKGKKVVIVGRSNIVGKPLIPLLLEKDATVTICHSKTKNLSEETRMADIIIMAIGKAKFLKREDIKQGAILIDVGINFEGGKIVGDIDFENIREKAEACTPVPGGIGLITNVLLIDNIIRCCEIYDKNNYKSEL